MMTTNDLENWVKSVQKDLLELMQQDFGYPLGTNIIREPAIAIPNEVPSQLHKFYHSVDGLSLPDVHVGYFIDAATRAASAPQRGEPVFLAGKPEIAIHVFGSDGGGGRFAISTSNGYIYYLPSSGVVREGKFFEDSTSPVRRVAKNIDDFLSKLKKDIHAFVQGSEVHEYMVL